MGKVIQPKSFQWSGYTFDLFGDNHDLLSPKQIISLLFPYDLAAFKQFLQDFPDLIHVSMLPYMIDALMSTIQSIKFNTTNTYKLFVNFAKDFPVYLEFYAKGGAIQYFGPHQSSLSSHYNRKQVKKGKVRTELKINPYPARKFNLNNFMEWNWNPPTSLE